MNLASAEEYNLDDFDLEIDNDEGRIASALAGYEHRQSRRLWSIVAMILVAFAANVGHDIYFRIQARRSAAAASKAIVEAAKAIEPSLPNINDRWR